MKLLDRLFRRTEKRSYTLTDPYLAESRGFGVGTVSPAKAVGIPTVFACVQLISETVASLPLNLYRRADDGSRVIEHGHPLQIVLHDQANQIQTALEFREQLCASVLLTGNGFAQIVSDGAGRIVELLPMNPGSVQVEQLVNGRLRYKHSRPDGRTEVLIQDEVLHVKFRTTNGITGLSPVSVAREALGIAVSHQDTESALYKNGARLAGVLTHPGAVEDKEQLRKDWERLYSGSASAYRTAVLEKGLEFKPIAMSMEDAQFIESRKLNQEEIARIFRVPPPAIGILTDATYSNVTELGVWLLKYTLRPWMVRIEQAINSSLLPAGSPLFVEHNAEGLLRGSLKERAEAYQSARQSGWMSANEIRRKENLPPVEGGDKFLEPLNMQNAANQAG